MDTYEEKDNLLTPEAEIPQAVPLAEEPTPSEEIPQPVSDQGETESADGFYHGVGVQEVTYVATPPTENTEEPQDTAVDNGPVRASCSKRRRKKSGVGKKVLKLAVACVLIIALVSAACGLSIVITNNHWQVYTQNLMQNFEQQIQLLRQEVEDAQRNHSSSTVVPTEGMTPSQIYQKNIKSVVAVNSTIRTTENGKVYEATGAGSGFVLHQDGYIVTNYHVIEGSTAVYVTFADGTQLPAQIIGSDAVNDIALLKVGAANLVPVPIGRSSDLCVGDQVVAIGNALGELTSSLTVGYISGIDRSISTDGFVISMLQTDASINSGNSGGPLFNSRGEVIGITTAKYSGTTASGATIEGIGFAIPMDDVYGMLEDLRLYGYITGAYMGVRVQDVDPVAAELYGLPLGAYVVESTFGYAAHRAGIQTKDIITNVGGYDITCMSDLTRVLRNFKAGDETTVIVWRSGKWIPLLITFDEKPHN